MKPTLIIVDDIPVIRVAIRKKLQDHFEILAECEDGLSAVEACRHHRPQLVVMDVVMPKMSGIEATRKILADKSGTVPKIVMVSGLKDETVVLQALEAGAGDYLFKPVNFEQLLQVLNGFLKSVA